MTRRQPFSELVSVRWYMTNTWGGWSWSALGSVHPYQSMCQNSRGDRGGLEIT